jgi:hypothetical protein
MDNLEKLATIGTQDEDKQNNKYNTICVGDCYPQTNTHTQTLKRQTTGGKDEPNIVSSYTEIVTDITTRSSERKDPY